MSLPVPAISYAVFNYAKQRLLDASLGFNALINTTAATYGVAPFQLSESGAQTGLLYEGTFNIPALMQAGAPVVFPCAVLSTAKSNAAGNQAMRVTPSTFSGQVILSLDFYVKYDTGGVPLGESMYHAVEDAVIATFNDPDYYIPNPPPPGVTYNNEIAVEQDVMGYSGTYWLQMIPCTLFFYRVA